MPSLTSGEGLPTFEQARAIVEEHAAAVLAARCAALGSEALESASLGSELLESEGLDLLAAGGRILAEPIVADRDFPPFPRATRDGYAVRAADVAQVPARLEIIGEIKAGDPAGTRALGPGQAISIMTGAPLPPNADAVVMVEYTAASGSSVEIQNTIKSGENYVPSGAEARSGQVLVERGQRLDHSLIAIAAAVGKSRIAVFRKPRVAVLATGDELVELDAAPAPSQIRNSNSYSLAAQIEEAGGEAMRMPIAPDEPARLRELIEQGLHSDLLLITGGVSMGKYDLVEQVLTALQAKFYFTGARIQPGKPVVFGSCGGDARAPHYFFGLPGNPVSTMVTFRLFVQPMLAALGGAQPKPLVFLKARLKADVRTKTGLTRFLPATTLGSFENAGVELAAWQGSGDIAALARSNCYLVVPPDREGIAAGEWVSVLLR